MRDYKIRYCPKCGHIETLNPRISPVCDYCNSNLLDTKYDVLDALDKGNLKREVEKDIKENYINKSTLQEDVVKDREEQERYNRLHMPSSGGYSSQNQPKCPTCQSTNVTKITSTKKAIGFAAVGIFSSNFGKTMECKNCGYKW